MGLGIQGGITAINNPLLLAVTHRYVKAFSAALTASWLMPSSWASTPNDLPAAIPSFSTFLLSRYATLTTSSLYALILLKHKIKGRMK